MSEDADISRVWPWKSQTLDVVPKNRRQRGRPCAPRAAYQNRVAEAK